MKLVRLAFIMIAAAMFLFSCGRNKNKANDAIADSIYINDANTPSEEEIGEIMDTAKQEKPKVREELQGLHIYVSKTTMQLYVLDKSDSIIFQCGIACGLRRGNKQEKGDYKTPEGDFHISGMFNSTDWIHHTKDGRDVKGCYGPHFLRLSTGRFGGIGIHGTNSPRSIGHRASEGCVRVHSDNIITLFEKYAYNGMPVTVSAENAPLPIFKGMSQREETATQKDTIKHEQTIKDTPKEEVPQHTPHTEHYDVDSLFS